MQFLGAGDPGRSLQGKQREVLVATFVGEPLDWLQQRLQHLDAASKPLLDLQREETNPFRAALRVYTDMLTKPFQETHFAMLARAFAPGRTPEERAEVSALVRPAGANLVTHLHWRFAVPLSMWPYTLVRLVDHGLSAAARA